MSDIISRLSPFLDTHMILLLIEYVEGLHLYNSEDILRSKLDILASTNMLDYAIELSGAAPSEEMQQRRDAVVRTLIELKENSQPLLDLFEKPNEKPAGAEEGEEDEEAAGESASKALSPIEKLKEEGELKVEVLDRKYGITPDIISAFSQYSKFQYECGNYEEAANFLDVSRVIDPDYSFYALWGKLASEILMMQWDDTAVIDALADLLELQKQIDARDNQIGFRTSAGTVNHLEQLQMRSWWLHWGLFVFFTHPDGREHLIELFLQNRYLNAIQINCPHLLRYLAVAVVTNKVSRSNLETVVRVIEQERSTYSDPITDFIYFLYSKYDVDGALDMLAECEKVMKMDYFLGNLTNVFIETARVTAMEIYARANTSIDFQMICDKLRMSPEDAEQWVVNLIRSSRRIDAKIDAEHGRVVIASSHQPEFHQQIIESTKDLTYRAQQLLGHIATMQNEGTMQ